MWTSDGAGEQRSRGAGEQRTPRAFTPPHLRSPEGAPRLTLILGLGNPILGDDGVGWRVVEEVQKQYALARDGIYHNAISSEGWDCFRAAALRNDIGSAVEFDYASLGGLALMERLVGYDRAILVDAIQTADGVPGTIYRLTLDDLPTLNADSAHDASLKAALALGRRLEAILPQDVVIFGIEAVNVLDFNESLSPQVAASVGRAAELVLAELANSR